MSHNEPVPLVSVIVASYNHSRYLRQCINSVLGQIFGDFELLIIDDRSTDNSLEVARSYNDPRIRVLLNEQNIGTYATENKGLDMATGEYAAILNSDDYWDPRKLERQMALLREHPEASFSYTLGEVVDEEGIALPAFNQHADWPREPLQDVLPYLLDVNQILASSLVFKRDAVRFETHLRYCGDWVAALRLAQQGLAVFVNEPLTFWRQHEANSSKQLAKTIGEEIRVRSEILSNADTFIVKTKDKEVAKQELAHCGLDLAAHWILVGKVGEARQALSKARAYAPSNLTVWKRWLSTFLPLDTARRHLWPNVDWNQVNQQWRLAAPVKILGSGPSPADDRAGGEGAGGEVP